MSDDRWSRIEELYHAALELPPEQRAAFLSDTSGGDSELRREVESLLAEHHSKDSVFDQPALAEMSAGDKPASPTAALLGAGAVLGPYRITGLLGAGGMGQVYRADDSRLHRAVAIKVLFPGQDVRRFEREARAVAALSHPNVVPIFDVGHDGGFDYLVEELVDGEPLRELLRRGPLGIARFRHLAGQIAEGLAAAHHAGIVHRDLKPGNIMVSREGCARILDFGLATSHRAGSEDATISLSHPGAVAGTAAYMSPEQVQGSRVDARSDIFSYGAVLYEMIAGRRAFARDTITATLAAVLEDDPPPVGEVVAGVPRELARIIHRCLRKDPSRRFQVIDDVRIAIEDLQEETKPAVAVPTKRGRPWRAAAVMSVVLLAAIAGLAGGWWMSRTGKPVDRTILTRLTSESGWATDPALSPDGRLVAYASDSGGAGALNIWMRQAPDGVPIQITRGEVDSREPSFSPDGQLIAFSSTRDSGGIYVVPVLGKEARRIANGGHRPRFSPDGKQVAYWNGPDILHGTQPGVQGVFVVAAAGGPARAIAPEFSAARSPVWSPDGKQLLFYGSRKTIAAGESTDWWVASLAEGTVTPLHAREVLDPYESSLSVPDAWTAGRRILFSTRLGDSTNIWGIEIARGGSRLVGGPERLTFGTGVEDSPSISGTRLVFATSASRVELWSLPAKVNEGLVNGKIEKITQNAGWNYFPSLSTDGKRMVFQSDRNGVLGTWFRDLETGKEIDLSLSPHRGPSLPFLSANGSMAVYPAADENYRVALYGVTIAKDYTIGAPRRLCDDCDVPWTWSPDGSKVLYSLDPAPHEVHVLNTLTGERHEILRSANVMVRFRWSPDGRWIAFQTRRGPLSRLFVAPYRESSVPQEQEWIPATDGRQADLFPDWSPSGALLYYYSDRDGNTCLWAQPFDRATGRPKGSAFAVEHFHDARQSLRMPQPYLGVALSQNRIVLNANETTGSIWMAESKRQRE